MASIVQRIWREGDRTSDVATTPTITTLNAVLPSSPTTGNLLVMYAVGRTATSAPAITFAGSGSQSVTLAGTASPMEFHTVALGYRVVQASDPTGWTATFSIASHSTKIGIVEFDLTSAALDVAKIAGSSTSNVSSIASGSTGTLSSSTGLWVSAGTSRTGTAGLSHDGGGALLFNSNTHHDDTTAGGVNATDPHDHGTANSAAAWANLSGTGALDITWSESAGASRMGTVLAVFVQAGGSTPIGAQVMVVA